MKNILLLISTSLFISLFYYCQSYEQVLPPKLPYASLHDSVNYVGGETCASCHKEIYDSFMETGMGKSLHYATKTKSAAHFDQHTAVYDSINDFYYKPFWRGTDSLFILEYRLENEDTIYKRTQQVRYIIGSGQHTNSHLYEENGYVYQAPITFYTQKGIWDLAPGFEGGFSSRFNRIIGLECMSCHNSLPNFAEGSENKYHEIPLGISCERCHGPGEVHVQEKLAGILVDTATQVDYSIVNPSKLPTRGLQMSVCQRCHLQGVAILKEGKNFDDFRPAMNLHTVMDVFLPEFDGNETQFIMASQAHRLTKSACYKNSNMTCLSCHNPHVSVTKTPAKTFNRACEGCHQQQTCTIDLSERKQSNNNNCASCHMPVSGSIDIPHVTIHDHYIRRPIPDTEKHAVENFIGLANVTSTTTSPLNWAKAYLHYYESYSNVSTLLDSVTVYLNQSKLSNLKKLPVAVHLAYLQNNMSTVITLSKSTALHHIKDAWTAYRIGEAYLQKKQYVEAEKYFEHAVALLPLNADFNNKLGVAYLQNAKFEAAKLIFEKIIEENPTHAAALCNLGYVCVNLGAFSKAMHLYNKALQLNPDYEKALLNKAALFLLQRKTSDAKMIVKKVLQLNPANEDAKYLWKQLI